MGLLDDLKTQAQKLAGSHGDKGKEAVDKAADIVDDKTGGKHTEHIEKGAEAGKDAIDNLAEGGDQG